MLERATTPADAPLRLDTAARLGFPDGTMTESGLRREAKRGRLAVFKIAGKHYTTLAEIEAMKERCRDTQKAPAYGSGAPGQTMPEPMPAPGSSSTASVTKAQAALATTFEELKDSLRATSRRNTPKARDTATVIRAQFRSRM